MNRPESLREVQPKTPCLHRAVSLLFIEAGLVFMLAPQIRLSSSGCA